MAVMRVVSSTGKTYYRPLRKGEVSNTNQDEKVKPKQTGMNPASTMDWMENEKVRAPKKKSTVAKKVAVDKDRTPFIPVDLSNEPETKVVPSTLQKGKGFLMVKAQFKTVHGEEYTGYRTAEVVNL